MVAQEKEEEKITYMLRRRSERNTPVRSVKAAIELHAYILNNIFWKSTCVESFSGGGGQLTQSIESFHGWNEGTESSCKLVILGYGYEICLCFKLL